MKLGIIADIHNNVTALKVAMKQFDQMKCDKILCCGDIIGIGPYPEQTVQYMMQIPNLIAVRGNHEGYLLDGMPEEYPNEEQMDKEEMLHHKWEHSMLSAESVGFLKKLTYVQELFIEGHKISILHYCMDRAGHYVNYTPNPSGNELSTMFADIDSDIILFGHDHSRTICTVGDKWYCNVGSLGCPGSDKNLARAGVLTVEQHTVRIEPLEIRYDVGCVVDEINRLDYPAAGNIKKFFYGIW
ncbi:MAG: metallophosphoesterase family protein [Lachnospiraceae bacterium]